MIRFTPARTYLTAAAVALGLAAFSGWCALSWLPAAIPAVLLLASALFVLWLGLHPTVEVTDTHLKSGKKLIPWASVRRIDQTGWVAPMVVDLTLADSAKIRLIYPGETDNANQLLRLIQQRSTQSLINGVPHSQIFGEAAKPQAQMKEAIPSPHYPLLTPEDEAEVERLYHKLRTAGRLDPEK
ncbi:DUF3093 family protein [Paludibaculum fermentans]|uniref:Uncharacterized protein n=1 Tax=Paludibaculum fermentans TaxID=1473598 RepID=A0A7S7NWA5_PALFE|nr:DUF3093 family protein [Paludibaculum fermentans]QOY90991.1 hypothetical protein IRI77_13915 [Paludibaculum fermentans]